MDPLVEAGLTIAAWSLGFAALGALPSVFLLRRRRGWAGGMGLLLTSGPILAWLGLLFADLRRVMRTAPIGSGSREAPWGGMGGLWITGPFFWALLMLVVFGAVASAFVLVDRKRARRVP